MTQPLHLTPTLIDRIDGVEFAYSEGRMGAIRDVFGDPGLVTFVDESPLRALMAKIPNPYFNRMLLSGVTPAQDLQRMLARYESAGATPGIEVSPGAIDEATGKWLRDAGFVQSHFHPIFVGRTSALQPKKPALDVRKLSSVQDLTAFQDLYVEGWEVNEGFAPTMKKYVARWERQPGWSLYLALDGGVPVACAVLTVSDGIAYLADAATPARFRGKGAQTSLLHARIAEAQRLGTELVFSRADFASVSQKNMERVGLQTLYMRSVWTRLALI